MTLFSKPITALAQNIIHELRAQKMRLGFAESCTGGLLSAAVTSIPGSSDVFSIAHVTYANEAKQKYANVTEKTLNVHGAVSAEVAAQMCQGLLQNNPELYWAVSVTGIAGPGGGSLDKPVGLVWIGCAQRNRLPHTHRYIFQGDRESIRLQSVEAALQILWNDVQGDQF